MQWAGFASYCAVFSSIYGRPQTPQCSSLAWFLTCPLLCVSRRYRKLWCSHSCSFWFCPSSWTRLLTCPFFATTVPGVIEQKTVEAPQSQLCVFVQFLDRVVHMPVVVVDRCVGRQCRKLWFIRSCSSLPGGRCPCCAGPRGFFDKVVQMPVVVHDSAVVDVLVAQVDVEMTSSRTWFLTCPLACRQVHGCDCAWNYGVPAVAVHRGGRDMPPFVRCNRWRSSTKTFVIHTVRTTTTTSTNTTTILSHFGSSR